MRCPQVEEEEPDMPHSKVARLGGQTDVARLGGQTEVARRSPLQATTNSSSSSVHDEPSSSQALAEQGMSVASLQVDTVGVLMNPDTDPDLLTLGHTAGERAGDRCPAAGVRALPQGAAGQRGVPGLFLHPARAAGALLQQRARHLCQVQGQGGGVPHLQGGHDLLCQPSGGHHHPADSAPLRLAGGWLHRALRYLRNRRTRGAVRLPAGPLSALGL